MKFPDARTVAVDEKMAGAIVAVMVPFTVTVPVDELFMPYAPEIAPPVTLPVTFTAPLLVFETP